jgi:O-antigen ligase
MKAGGQRVVSVSRLPAAWPRDTAERAILWAFVAALAWVPFWYGSNDWIAWGVNAVLFPGLTALFELLVITSGQRHPIGIRNLAVPAMLALAAGSWAAFQTVTWTGSPLVNPIWELAAEALDHPVARSISVNRDLTILALVRLITAASAFWLAVQLCRNSARAMTLITSIGVIGCAYAAYGLIAMKTGPLPWLSYLPSTEKFVSSTFINRDNYATYAGMGFIIMAGLILQRYQAELSEPTEGLRPMAASIIENSSGTGAALLAGGFLTLVALLFTGSRGGLLATSLGLFVLTILGRSRRGNQQQEHLALAIFGVVLVSATFLVFGGAVATKIEANGVYDASRMSVYVLALRSIVSLPLLGYGYGTFVDVFPMFRDRSIGVAGRWAEAHDTYLEILQGLGVVLGSMLIASVVVLVCRCVRGARQRRRDAMLPRVAASVAALVGVHALVDFGLQMQAIAITLMAILGAGVAQSESSRLALHD